jgi:hypothetical protein
MFGVSKLLQYGNQQAMFQVRVALDPQAQLLILVGTAKQKSFEVEIKPRMLDLKEQAPLKNLDFQVVMSGV